MNTDTRHAAAGTPILSAWDGRCPRCLGAMELVQTYGIFRRRRCLDKQCGETVDTRENPTSGLEFRRIQAARRNGQRQKG